MVSHPVLVQSRLLLNNSCPGASRGLLRVIGIEQAPHRGDIGHKGNKRPCHTLQDFSKHFQNDLLKLCSEQSAACIIKDEGGQMVQRYGTEQNIHVHIFN